MGNKRGEFASVMKQQKIRILRETGEKTETAIR